MIGSESIYNFSAINLSIYNDPNYKSINPYFNIPVLFKLNLQSEISIPEAPSFV
jgi:hypothetical protein